MLHLSFFFFSFAVLALPGPCNNANPGKVTDYKNNSLSAVNPTLVSAFVLGGDLQINFEVDLPKPYPSAIDIMFLVDNSMNVSAFALATLQAAMINDFAKTYNSDVHFGLSTFSNHATCFPEFASGLKHYLTDIVKDFQEAVSVYVQPNTKLGCALVIDSNALIDTFISISAPSAGWRDNAYKVVVVVSGSAFSDARSSDLKNALAANNIVPLFVTSPSGLTAYGNLVSSLGFGLVANTSDDGKNVFEVANAEIAAAFATVWAPVVNDPQGFVSAKSSTVSNVALPSNVTAWIKVKSGTQTNPVKAIDVVFIGWGKSTVLPSLNSVPTSSDIVFQFLVGDNLHDVTLPISVTDPDGDAVTVIIEDTPAQGTLYPSSTDMNNLAKGDQLPLPDGSTIPYMIYRPLTSFSGSDSFKASFSDGCGKSPIFTFTVQTQKTDNPPIADDITASVKIGLSHSIDFFQELHASDTLQDYTTLDYYVATLPPTLLASLSSAQQAINAGDKISNGVLTISAATAMCCDDIVFQYYVKNSLEMTSNIATVTIKVLPDPTAPVTLPNSPVYVSGNGANPISLNVFTPDPSEKLDVIMDDFGQSGTFKFGGELFTTPGGLFGIPIASSVTPDNYGLNTQTIDFIPIPNVLETAFIWSATGVNGGQSGPFTTTIKYIPNNPPVATAVNPITMTSSMDANNAPVFTLTGTDPDATETQLLVVITEVPSQGTITCDDGFLNSPLPYTGYAPMQCQLTTSSAVPSFVARLVFHVTDTPGAISEPVIVPFTVLDVTSDDTKASTITASYNMATGSFNTGYLLVYNKDVLFTPQAYIDSLPATGSLFQYTGEYIATVPTRITDPLFRFKFQTSASTQVSFTFYGTNVGDTRKTASTTLVLNVSPGGVNIPPILQNTYISQDKSQSLTTPISVSYQDVDTAASSITFIIDVAAPDMGRFGSPVPVRSSSNGASYIVPSGGTFPVTSITTITELSDPGYSGPSYMLFYLYDGDSVSNIARYNVYYYCTGGASSCTPNPPVVDDATYNVYVGEKATISINVHDPDWLQVFTLNLVVVGGAAGTFSDDTSTPPWTTTTFSFPNVMQNQKSYTTSYILYYTPDSNAIPGTFTIQATATDQAGNTGATASITINVLKQVPTPPIATVPGLLTVAWYQASSDFKLGADNIPNGQSYTVQFTQLPTKCVIYTYAGPSHPAADTVTQYAGTVNFFILANGLYGSDFFVFQVIYNGIPSTPVIGKIQITIPNNAPTARYLVADQPVDGLLQIQLFAEDPDPNDSCSFYIASVPGDLQLKQSDKTTDINSPGLVTDPHGIIYITYEEVPQGSVQFEFYATDKSITNSHAVTITITIPTPPLPPFMYDVTGEMLQNETNWFALGVSAAINNPATVAVIQIPAGLEGNLYTSSGQQITWDHANLDSDVRLTVKPAANTLLIPGDYDITYQALSTTTLVASKMAKLTLTVHPVPPTATPPTFSGSTSYGILQNSSADILFVGTSATDKYGVEIMGISSGKLYSINGTELTAIDQYPFLLSDALAVKRAKYTPPTADIYGENVTLIAVRVKDANGVSDITNISLSIYKRHTVPTLSSSPVVYSNGTSAPWQWGDQIQVAKETCANVGVVINDPDSTSSSLSLIIFGVPAFGQLHSVSADGTVLQNQSMVPADSTGLVTLFYCPNQGVEDKNDSFTFAATDNDAISEPQSVYFNVMKGNKVPTLTTGDAAPTPAPTSAPDPTPTTSSSPTPAPNPVTTEHHSNRTPKIIGGVIGGIAGVTIVGAVAVFFIATKYVTTTVAERGDALL